MPVVAIGVMRLDDWRQGLKFKAQAERSLREARRTEGCLHADATQIDDLYYSLSMWRDEASIAAFMRAPGHAQAMRSLARYGASLGFLKYEAEICPDWDDAKERWSAHLREPSATAPKSL